MTPTGARVEFGGDRVVEFLKVLEQMAAGDLCQRLAISANHDELDAIAHGLNVLVGELGWTDTQKYANPQTLLNGEIGKFRGVRFIESTRVANDKSLLFGPDFFAWGDYQTIQAYRVAPGGDHADPLAQRGLVGWKGMWGLTTVKFAGTPAMGPATNITAERWTQADFTP